VTVLFDTNIVLDVLLDRAPHAEGAVRLFAEIERGRLLGLLGAPTITTVHYLARRAVGARRARRHLLTLLTLFSVAPVTHDVLIGALDLSFTDYEDAVLHEAGRLSGAEAIVTRDSTGFVRSHLRVYTPLELLSILKTATS
jgi:predicted nucleic acid-binding protein